MSATLQAILIFTYIQKGAYSDTLLSKLKDFTHKLHEPRNWSLVDPPLPGIGSKTRSVTDIPFLVMNHQNLSVKDISLPITDPPNQSVSDIPFLEIDTKTQLLTDTPLPNIDPSNQSETGILLPRIGPQNQSVIDIPLPGMDPQNQSVTDIPLPREDTDLLSDYDDECLDFFHFALKQNRETYSSTESDHSPTSSKESELNILKENPEKMQEFLDKYQQSNKSDMKQCYNDTKCIYFGDCCPDKQQYSMDKTYEFYKCFEIRDIFSTVNYLLIYKCFPFINNDTDTKKKCEQESNPEFPPVTSNDVGRFYRNEFCAKCNGEFEYTKWNVEIAFDDSDWFDQIIHIRNLTDVVDFMKRRIRHSVIFFIIPPGISEPWKCNMNYDYIDKCNVTGLVLTIEPWEQIGCQSFTDPVDFYRNVYCKRCNWDLLCDLTLDNMNNQVSFSALMDLNVLQEYKEDLEAKEKKNSCQDYEFYDYIYERCRRLYCSHGLFLTPNSTCSYIMTSASGISYKIHFSVIPQNGDIDEEEAAHIINEILKTTEGKMFPESVCSLVTFKYQLNNQTHQNSSSVVDKILFYINFKVGPFKFVKLDENIEKLFSEISRIRFKGSYHIVKDLESLKFSENYISTLMYNVSLYNPKFSCDVSLFSPQRAILYSDIRLCPKVMLSSEEFIENEDNLVISIKTSRVNLTMDRVEFNSNSTAMICLSDYPNNSPKLEFPTPDPIEIILSNIFLGFSLLCLAITLSTYAMFSELRTLPGKCNILLCSTLFAAQALILIGSYDDEIVCSVVGCIRHFAWLSTFGWLSVCSFHMYRVFTRLLMWNDQNSNKILYKYASIAYMFPLLVVGGTVIINMALSRVTGYGPPACFLNQGLQLILAFALPLSLMIIFNTTLLLITICSLVKTAKQCKMVNRDKRRVVVYLKLSSLTGITWIFGFLSMSFPQSWLKYIFVITNASQGIFVFLSYTLNANVLKLYASKFPCLHIPIKHNRSTSVYTSASVSTTSTVS